jgi:hypothetical protein
VRKVERGIDDARDAVWRGTRRNAGTLPGGGLIFRVEVDVVVVDENERL